MAKAKSPKEIVCDYFQGIKYYAEDDNMIVILPDGLSQEKAELEDNTLKLGLKVENLDNFTVSCELRAAGEKAAEVLILQETDAKSFIG